MPWCNAVIRRQRWKDTTFQEPPERILNAASSAWWKSVARRPGEVVCRGLAEAARPPTTEDQEDQRAVHGSETRERGREWKHDDDQAATKQLELALLMELVD